MENHDGKQPETENYILLLKNYLNLEQKLAIIDEAKSRSNRKTAKNMVGLKLLFEIGGKTRQNSELS